MDRLYSEIKLLVTHQNPDLDAIGACWLWRQFGGSAFDKTEYYFVKAGEEVETEVLSARGIGVNEVIHVDTGLGRFDHHQPGNLAHDSACFRVYQYLVEEHRELQNDEALKRVVGFINETDHFGAYYWPEPDKDRYEFMLEEILAGLRSGKHFTDRELVEFGMVCLDGVYTSMKIKTGAEEDLEKLGQEFETKWGKALAIENQNDEVVKLAQKKGFMLVVRKDAKEGHVRIKTAPIASISLSRIYEKLKTMDQEGTWYYHPSGHMVLNGSKKNQGQIATKLSLAQVVGVVKEG